VDFIPVSKLDWTPQQQPGGIYCSPACGCGCKADDHNRAALEAREDAARLGQGWEPRVWENGGWHGKVVKGAAEVMRYKSYQLGTVYTAYIRSARLFTGSGPTPEEALDRALSEARETVDKVTLDILRIMERD
jgi:hypothetical protein